MQHHALLIGISRYPDHAIAGVPHDLALLRQALLRRNYPEAAIEVCLDTHPTRADLHALLSRIAARYARIEQGSLYVHISASGALQIEPLAGGVLPIDGDGGVLESTLSFAELNRYLPQHPDIRVVLTLDT